MKRIEATHFIEVCRARTIDVVFNEDIMPIDKLSKALIDTVGIKFTTIAIFKIRFK